jgi:hypothetical protein
VHMHVNMQAIRGLRASQEVEWHGREIGSVLEPAFPLPSIPPASLSFIAALSPTGFPSPRRKVALSFIPALPPITAAWTLLCALLPAKNLYAWRETHMHGLVRVVGTLVEFLDDDPLERHWLASKLFRRV